MLTDKDISKLIKVFPTRDAVREIAREELVGVRRSVQDMVQGIDKLVTAFYKLNRECAAISEQPTGHEQWIKQIAKKAGVELQV